MVIKFSVYLNRRVFVMGNIVDPDNTARLHQHYKRFFFLYWSAEMKELMKLNTPGVRSDINGVRESITKTRLLKDIEKLTSKKLKIF